MADTNDNAPESEDVSPAETPQAAPEAEAPAPDAAPEADAVGPDLAAQVTELNDKLLRTLADAENTRRRAQRQVEDASKYAIANFAREMVDVVDNLHRALASVDAEARKSDEALEALCTGVEMTENAMLSAFERVGIRTIETDGKRFDPNLHEAMFEIENPDVPAGSILQVIRQGYVIGERLLRSAQVGVAKGGPKNVPDGPAEAGAYGPKGEPVGDAKGDNINEEL